ncbi:hypothetical protein AOQ84DRAFT_440781 [Glonium stellatum]|uniref:DUF6594 domain-containing protein n=1 Tax=Glonium stellatum TaxID=574774 RepID=A0A8E2EXN9_9PEZI|nr:hypothetical protein AOQ84DRAFT_440781 [Glonium stellatum]
MDDVPAVRGYPSLAENMARTPESAIFSTFAPLTNRDLLYRQAKLNKLHNKLKQVELTDYYKQRNLGGRQFYAQDWEDLVETDKAGKHSEQWELFLEIREELRQYRECLIQAATLASYPHPSRFDFGVIQNQLDDLHETDKFALIGHDCDIWGSTLDPTGYAPDMICLRTRQNLNEDPFTRWATGTFLPWFGKRYPWLKKNEPRYGGPSYVAETFLNITFYISTVIATILPIAAISVLYCVNSMRGRLITIAILSPLFSLCFNTFTNPRRVEIFIAVST